MVLANCLDTVGRQEEGLAANAEAIVELSSPFKQHRRAFAELIGRMARDYIHRCERLAHEPDQQLLAPVVAGLAELQADGAADGQAGTPERPRPGSVGAAAAGEGV
jgi:hypothetical protein